MYNTVRWTIPHINHSVKKNTQIIPRTIFLKSQIITNLPTAIIIIKIVHKVHIKATVTVTMMIFHAVSFKAMFV